MTDHTEMEKGQDLVHFCLLERNNWKDIGNSSTQLPGTLFPVLAKISTGATKRINETGTKTQCW
jgi:hypothetical protein